jgi:hypothetical protein
VWLWAASHRWHNLLFQAGRARSDEGLQLGFLGEFIAGNLLLLGPTVAVALVIAVVRFARRDPVRCTVLTAVLSPFVVFGLISLGARVGAHWGGPGVVPAVAVLALTAVPARRWLIGLGVVWTAAMVLLVVAMVARPQPFIDLELAYAGRPERLTTSKLRHLVGNAEVVRQIGARHDDEVLLMSSYTQVHLYAYLSGGRLEPRLAHLTGGKHGLASLYWYAPDDLVGREALVVTESSRLPRLIAPYCSPLEEEEPLEVVREGRVVRSFRVLRCGSILRDDGAFTRATR